ncbi:MAG: ATP-binding protein [Firmicutes bacterium]|nr:ATP-binding protein [Bacillota bacterium]
MRRKIYNSLCQWKDDPQRKPLVLEGARQVGKTWTLKEFGKINFNNMVYINCDHNPQTAGLFQDFDIQRILRYLSAISGQTIIPGKTFIFLDEIQEEPLGLTSLKYFCENAREYHIAVAGSLLGLSVHEGSGFPVGKVDELNMYPMTFREFLWAIGQERLADLLDTENPENLSPMADTFIELLRQYYYVGGMPEAVAAYADSQDLKRVRRIQDRIVSDYDADFSKHIPAALLPRVRMVWNSIPSQLARENKKFTYSIMKKGARAKDYDMAITWLKDAGLVYPVTKVNQFSKPLNFYEDPDAFKLYALDLGLLGAMAQTDPADILTGNTGFVEYKGAFTEQYVAQQLIATLHNKLHYYSRSDSRMELDFVYQSGNVYAIEVKAEENLNAKSLKTILDKHPEVIGLRLSMSGYRKEDRLINIPLYLVESWFGKLEE